MTTIQSTASALVAAIYCRISQDRTGAGLGVERQRQDCMALAARLGYTVVEVFTDNDVSAYSGKARKGYARMLEAIEAGRVNVVVTWHTDRLHRSPKELETYIDACERRGVTTQTVTAGTLDLATPTGRMAARIFGAVARQESEHKSERIRRAYQQRVTSGGNPGGTRPFGFVDRVTVDPAEAAEIRRATKMILSGSSIRAVARDFNARGVPPVKVSAWGPESMRDMLVRPRNAGILVYRGEEIGPAPWDPIVTESEFRAIVALMSDPSRCTTPGPAPKWLGSGVFHCGECTSRVVCTRSNGSNMPTYRCSTKRSGHPSRKAEPVEEYVLAHVFKRLSKPDAADLLLPVDSGEDVPALLAEKARQQAKLDGLAKALAADQMTLPQVIEATAIIREQIGRLDGRIASATAVDPVAALVGGESADDVADRWEALDFDVKRAVLRELVDVTILRAPGRAPDGSYFNPASLRIKWRRGAEQAAVS